MEVSVYIDDTITKNLLSVWVDCWEYLVEGRWGSLELSPDIAEGHVEILIALEGRHFDDNFEVNAEDGYYLNHI